MAASNRILALIPGFLLAMAILPARGDDWPQWRGPRQDGISRETGLLAQCREKGPKELWHVPLGSGFSAVSVVDDRAYTCFGASDAEFAVCLNMADGKTLWKTRLGDLFKSDSYGDGPRATPTVDAGRVYVLSGKGGLCCLNAADGHVNWGCDLLTKFGGGVPARGSPEYGFAASPVVMDDLLVVVVGAGGGKSLVAFDKISGKVRWTALNDKIGYSTPIEVTTDGVPQIIVLMGEALVSVSPKDGKEFWRHEWKTELDANVATPIISGDRLFISSGYSTGCALFALSAKDGKPAAEKLGQQGNEELLLHGGALERLSLRFQQQQADLPRLSYRQAQVEDGRFQSRQPDCRRRPVDHPGRVRHAGPGRGLAEGVPRNLEIPLLRRADLDRTHALRRPAVRAEREGIGMFHAQVKARGSCP